MKKNDKIILLVIIGIVMCIFSWIVSPGTFSSGTFVSSDKVTSGIFDYFLVIYYSLYYKCGDIFYLLVLGGTYGVLSKTKSYRKLVSKTAGLISGKEYIAMPIVTLLMGLFSAFTSTILPALLFVPFIITVFLKRGKDKITAACAALGGIFIGLIGQMYGTYGTSQILSATGLSISDGIVAKIIVFVVSYVLFNLFAILHMRKQKKIVNDTKSDPFTTEKLDEKFSKSTFISPTIILFLIVIIIGILGYVSWSTSFNVTVFEDFYTNTSDGIGMKILGSFSALGEWADALPIGFILLFATIIIALIDRCKPDDFVDNFADGIKKICKPVLAYVLALSIFIASYFFNWPVSIINFLLGDGTFNIFTILLVGIVGAFFYVDPDYIGYLLGSHLAIIHADNLISSTVMLHMGYGLGTLFVPSSTILVFILTYLDIPYKDWLKFIWKYALSLFVAILIICAIVF